MRNNISDALRHLDYIEAALWIAWIAIWLIIGGVSLFYFCDSAAQAELLRWMGIGGTK